MNPNDAQNGPMTPDQQPASASQDTQQVPGGYTSPADNISNSPLANPATNLSAPPRIKKSHKTLILIIASVVAALMFFGGIAWFIVSQSSTPPVVIEKPAPATEDQRVNVGQIDSTVTDIDKTLNTLDDSKDFTPNDISDAALGL